MCETDYSGYPDCRNVTLQALARAVEFGMDRKFVLHTPLMWIDKAATFALAQEIGEDALNNIIVEDTHSCYLGDRVHKNNWGYGCGECPACQLRAQGWKKWIVTKPE
jgi:7-cyano-7-deazaguanine synthase